MRFKKNNLLTLLGFLALTVTAPNIYAAELPYNDIIFFGDSLTDNGNLHHRTMGFIPKSPPYFEGRFSNGPTWAELVSEHYKQNKQIEADNYALGSATAVFHNPTKGYLPYTLKMMVYNYLAHYVGYDKSHTLYTIWIGANDYFYGAPDVDERTSAVIHGINANIESLISRGAKYFLVMNLPDLAQTPWGRAADNPANLTELIIEHNRKLAIMVDELQQKYPDIIIRLYDIYSDFVTLTTDPDIFNKKYNINLTDLTESCWPGGYTLKKKTQNQREELIREIEENWRQNGKPMTRDNSLNFDNASQLADTIINTPALSAAYDVAKQYKEGQQQCQNPDNHVFWDKVHPSRVVHGTFSKIMIDYIDQNFSEEPKPAPTHS